MARTYKKRSTKNKSIKKRGGGMAEGVAGLFMGAQYLRKGKFDNYLEERLVLHFNDVDFVKAIRAKFGYDKTNLKPWSVAGIKSRMCGRELDEQKLIAPNLMKSCPPK